jgi:hypothetical protein
MYLLCEHRSTGILVVSISGVREFAKARGYDVPECERILDRELSGKLNQPQPADHFAHAMGAVMLEMQKDNEKGDIRDHVGEIYE